MLSLLWNSYYICICTSIHTHSIPTFLVQHNEFCMYRIKPEATNSWEYNKKKPHNCRIWLFACIGQFACTSQLILSIQSHKSETAATVTKPDKLIAKALSGSVLFCLCFLGKKFILPRCVCPWEWFTSQNTSQIFIKFSIHSLLWNVLVGRRHIFYLYYIIVTVLQWFAAWFILRPWRWRRHVPLKPRLAFNGL
jgi:hypothetical protein